MAEKGTWSFEELTRMQNEQIQQAKDKLHERVENDLTYHEGPFNHENFYDDLRKYAKFLAHHIVQNCPINREQSIALTHIEEAVQWAIASVVRYPPPEK